MEPGLFKREPLSALCVGSFKFTWTVENFSWMTDETPLIAGSSELDFRSAVKSPLFVTGDVLTDHWAVLLHPTVVQYAKDSQLRTLRYERSSCVGVHLQLQRPNEAIRQVDFTISLLNSRGVVVYSRGKNVPVCDGYLGESKSRYQASTSGSLGGCSGWHDFILRRTLMTAGTTFLADDKLTIRCNMMLSFKSTIRSDCAPNPRSMQNGMEQDDLLTEMDLLNVGMYRLKKAYDVYLHCGKTKFGAHKRVLAARSTYLKVLFESRPADNYELLDVSDLAMRLVLNFIYGADVEKDLTLDVCRHVYTAAKKFALPDLMHRCSRIFINYIDVRSVCNTACWAHLYGDQETLAAVKRFVKANASEVLVSPEWVRLVQRIPELAVQLV